MVLVLSIFNSSSVLKLPLLQHSEVAAGFAPPKAEEKLRSRDGEQPTADDVELDRSQDRAASSISPARSTASNSFPPDPTTTNEFCVTWSTETDEWWTHAYEWVLGGENDTHQCFQKAANNYTIQLYRRLYENQWKTDCSRGVYTRHMYSSGWGSDIENVVLGMQKALWDHVPLLITQISAKPWWHYAAVKEDGSNPACPTRDMMCYFLPFGQNCTPAVPDPDYINLKRKYAKDFLAVQHYVTRPQKWLRREVYEYAKSIEIPPGRNNCTVLHIRRTDVVLHGSMARKYFPVSAYVNKMPRPDDPIFLVTDDQNAVDEAHEFFPNKQWNYFDRTRHRGTSGGWENVNPSKSPKQEVVVILATLKLVQRCNVLIHSRSKFSDALSRVMPNTERFQVDIGAIAMDAANQNSHLELERLLNGMRDNSTKSLDSTAALHTPPNPDFQDENQQASVDSYLLERWEVARKTLVAKIDAYDTHQIQNCADWLTNETISATLQHATIRPEDFDSAKSCPILYTTLVPRAAIDPNTGAVKVAPDAILMCHVIGRLMERGGYLPSNTTNMKEQRLVLLDVGAAFATELVVAHTLGFNVYSFEARKVEYDKIANEWAERLSPRAHIINAAVSNIPGGRGALDLYNADDSSSLHNEAVSFSRREKRKVRMMRRQGQASIEHVPAYSLDYFAANNMTSHNGIVFLKIDVQGHEFEVLQGAYGILTTHHPALFFEYEVGFRGEKSPTVLCYVKALGYECSLFGSLTGMVLCVHPEKSSRFVEPQR